LQAIAGGYGKLGELSEALECYVRALGIRENELGKDHPEVAVTLHNLGVVFEKLSEHNEALDSLHRALLIRERRLGPLHPQTARTLHSIGIVYSQMLDYTSALAFYQRALTICKGKTGQGTHAAATLNNMGVVYAKLGKMDLALQHHEQAFQIQERILGPMHNDTVATKYNLQVLTAEMDKAANTSIFDHVRQFFAMALMPEPPSTSSLLGLLCYESSEIDGPVDEPLCGGVVTSCAGSSCTLRQNFKQAPLLQVHGLMQDPQRATMLQHDLASVGGVHPETSRHCKVGVPEPRRRTKVYPPAKENYPARGDAFPSVAGALQTNLPSGRGRHETQAVRGKLSL